MTMTTTTGKTRRWFPAASHGRYEISGVHAIWRPASLVHAKQVGTARAACGAVSPNWQTFWELRFHLVERDNLCVECREAVATAGAGDSQETSRA
jgi:hypothetical protein